jgi:predicted Zn-dependent protease with MMP-like domain
VTEAQRERFDALVGDAIAALPARVRAMLDEVSVVVLDEPEPAMLKDLGVDLAEEPGALDEICGLHTGTMLTERGVEHGDLPTVIHLFRRGIVALAGGWERPNADDEVYEEVRVTLLHEIGHHFGLEEEDLEELGYE